MIWLPVFGVFFINLPLFSQVKKTREREALLLKILQYSSSFQLVSRHFICYDLLHKQTTR
ncbi:hypothetical protein D931_01421 [Enterococcus faecium 13.SD.W.09]|nr:hypothetical protein D931_01421 [Enterococcus faecium 13.SD.W.09]